MVSPLNKNVSFIARDIFILQSSSVLQALDPKYRSSVASLVSKLAEGSQFIATTFKPELLPHADKLIGITLANEVRILLHLLFSKWILLRMICVDLLVAGEPC